MNFILTIWEEMLKGKEHIAQVRNEYGLFLGVVSMEDIIETIIGQEIVDEKDTVADLQEYAREKWKEQTEQLEHELAQWVGKEDVMVYSTGFQVNLGVVSCVTGREDFVLCDELDHASIVEGRRLSFSTPRR